MPQIIVTAAVNDVEEWLKFKAEMVPRDVGGRVGRGQLRRPRWQQPGRQHMGRP
jgi:hypothetical protein